MRDPSIAMPADVAGYALAGVGSRFIALLIDGVILGAIGGIVGLIVDGDPASTNATASLLSIAIGAAYFDAHRVRTLPEVLMVVVGTENRIRRVQVLRFAEPPEYRPPDGWLARLVGRALDTELSERRGVDGITGATLTTRAVTGAARRTLSIHQVIAPFGSPPP